jgi:hypothetical protein
LKPTSLALIVAALAVPSHAAAQDAQAVHDGIVAVMARSGYRQPAADTSVTWSPRPLLYHTLTRRGATIETAMIRADGLVGAAEVTYAVATPVRARIQWSQDGKLLRDIGLSVRAGSLVVQDSVPRAYPLPTLRWLIADYGMDDLWLPVLGGITESATAVAVFRPYAAKWDTVLVRRRLGAAGPEVELQSAPDDLWTFVLAADGAILQILRSKYPDFERRPLEQSARVAAYLARRHAPAAAKP